MLVYVYVFIYECEEICLQVGANTQTHTHTHAVAMYMIGWKQLYVLSFSMLWFIYKCMYWNAYINTATNCAVNSKCQPVLDVFTIKFYSHFQLPAININNANQFISAYIYCIYIHMYTYKNVWTYSHSENSALTGKYIV